MSSRPGLTLEAFLMWNYDLIVDGDGSANPSQQIAEAMGNVSRRQTLSIEQFSPLVLLFELYRDSIETALNWFDEDNQSWRDYAGSAFDFIPRELYEQGLALVSGK